MSLRRVLLLLPLLLAACGLAPPAQRLEPLLPADILLLGEQHDAPEHHRLQTAIVAWLADRGSLAGLALEMAPRGTGTATLARDASEAEVRQALQWREAGWPWRDYGPAIMAAVRRGVPVQGANLPQAEQRAAMADASLDRQLGGPALKAQQQLIRLGHCGLLPETQIGPMTRIQIARDRAMAVQLQAMLRPGQTVLLLAGNGHVQRDLGVPQHLPRSLRTRVIQLQAGAGDEPLPGGPGADLVWTTAPLPPRDYCADVVQAPKRAP